MCYSPQQKNRILQINAIIFAAYTLISLGSASYLYRHTCRSLLFDGYYSRIWLKKGNDKVLLSAGLVLLIGFGTCIGLAALLEWFFIMKKAIAAWKNVFLPKIRFILRNGNVGLGCIIIIKHKKSISLYECQFYW